MSRTIIVCLCGLSLIMAGCGRRSVPVPPDASLKNTAPVVRDIKPQEYDPLIQS